MLVFHLPKSPADASKAVNVPDLLATS